MSNIWLVGIFGFCLGAAAASIFLSALLTPKLKEITRMANEIKRDAEAASERIKAARRQIEEGALPTKGRFRL